MRQIAWAITVGLVFSGALRVQDVLAQDVRLKIIAINDFHGNLESPGTFKGSAQSAEVPVGGADFLADYIARLKSENPLNVVVSAGDLTGASPLISSLFKDEDTIAAMNRMGLEINGVGNHEFDKGKKELLRKQHGCLNQFKDLCKGAAAGPGGVFEGAKFEYLSANVYDTATGKTLFPGYAIKTYDGVKVAFIGVTLKGTPDILTASAVVGLRFTDEATEINAIVRRLRGQGVSSFVVLVHQGGRQTTKGTPDMNACEGGLDGTPIQPIVNRLDDAVDLVISAHTHLEYVCQVPNSVGRKVTVTSASAYGRMLTDIDMTIDKKTKRVTQVTARNMLVDRTNPEIVPDAAVKAIVDKYAALAAPIANRVVGSITAEVTKPTTPAGETAMGDLIADAELDATSAPAAGGAAVAFINEDGIRTGLAFDLGIPGVGVGTVTYGELFSAQPFGNNLVTMTLTGAQIKTMLEEQFKGCGPAGEEVPSTDRMLEVSEGFSYAWKPGGTACEKVDAGSMRIGGAAVVPDAKYRVTVNNLLADGGAQFYVLKQGTDRLVGGGDLDAMEGYLKRHGPVAPVAPHRIRLEP